MTIRLVTDSTCDLPAELIERHGLLVIPAVLNLEGRSYRDGVDISRADFYARLPGLKELPKTAAPAAGDFEAVYRQCGEADIVSIHIASQLSGMLNSARVGAEASGQRVTLIDSGQVTMGLGWQVLAAAEAVAAGRPLPEVVAAVEAVQRRVKVMALLDTVEYLRRGGRASAFTATIGELLQIKPLLEVAEGQVVPLGRLRTRARAVDRLVEMVEALGPLERLAVLHTHSPDDARRLAERLARHLSLAYPPGQATEISQEDTGLAPRAVHPPLVVEATTVIGTHAGPNALGIAAVRRE
jgi:DegV family protein with EDD domain